MKVAFTWNPLQSPSSPSEHRDYEGQTGVSHLANTNNKKSHPEDEFFCYVSHLWAGLEIIGKIN